MGGQVSRSHVDDQQERFLYKLDVECQIILATGFK